jgi:hypothetical protein
MMLDAMKILNAVDLHVGRDLMLVIENARTRTNELWHP